MDQPYHIPVLAGELVNALQVKPAGVYADCTFGGGGHSGAILRALNQSGRLIAFDQDEDARLNIPDDPRIIFVPHNFRHLKKFLRLHKIDEVDGVIADLGVSSHQFDEAERGFSTRFEESLLDMRMDQRQELTAASILNSYTEQQLHKMFEQYGEVTNAKTLAKTIVQQRQLVSVKTVNEFKNAVSPVVKGNPNKYFAQVFQALRITVNDEMGSLREMLQQLPSLLKKGGRIAIITFHSVEDRMVKHFFRNGSFEETAADSLYGTKPESPFLIITKKPIVPSAAEIAANPRSRSAKLRVAEKK
ncbi:16S rRNA (cytosine(1402)-N(4))-methyltransferase RsmH [Agriterribacter sp.]|uniref:16S rRNA (cytosine(1402)-N(4))-methyltransferase RsmH n=1 Tax=Agriterribacter sp. TaxID=2821509 RepID=UPI002CF6117F|nr:16S rRNA (cytosine(1402)-N(4))-methyltransferase RsmH [Agriterribacter sp.]HTN06684.1 16S rRNA (cytosine(1402)-N(4))-methyltransferase RsmH [Agriterribacter sp.]